MGDGLSRSNSQITNLERAAELAGAQSAHTCLHRQVPLPEFSTPKPAISMHVPTLPRLMLAWSAKDSNDPLQTKL